MSETVSTGSGPNRSGPFFWLLAIGLIVALVGIGLLIRSVSDDGEDSESTTVAAVASVTPIPTPSPTASVTPTPTPTPSPTPTATATPTPEATAEAAETTTPTPRAEATPEPSAASAPAPQSPPPLPAEEPTLEATEEPTASETPTATPEATTAPPPPEGDAGAEGYAYGETDRIRSGVGVQALSTNSSLTAVARSWSASMRSTGVLNHNPNAPSQMPSGWSRWAENVAHASTITEAMSLLENSPPHYQNITYANFTDIGIGVVVDSNGWYWVTQLFAQY